MKEVIKMENENKCDKYEAFFVFKGEEELHKHLEECEDCRKEYEKYKKLSMLIKDAAPAYKAKQRKNKIFRLKAIACSFILFFGLSVVTGYRVYDEYSLSQYDPGSEYTYADSYGMPTDDYGFIEL